MWRILPGGAVTHGSFPWFRRTPQALFDDLRARGKYGPDDVIVQVNHPRDAIQGYFNAYGLSGDALSGIGPLDAPGKSGLFSPSGQGFGAGTFSLDFDALELLTGKRFDLLDTYRVPNPPPPEPHPAACAGNASDPKDCMGLPGTVVRDAMGTDQEKRAGIYFGTRSGKVFASRDEGESWTALADGLPPVYLAPPEQLYLPPGREDDDILTPSF